ncbi:glycine dehydrogenase [Aurantibacter sp.]|uniref:glycine dehydrogenase n=1 Tax=Aurantibacter sp. TaxID=2807103 RepID=UPI0035C807E9
MKKLFLPCEEANHVCDKSQYKESSFSEMIKLNLHLLYCKACRKYSSRNAKLTAILKREKPITMEQGIKNTLQKQIENQLKNQ